MHQGCPPWNGTQSVLHLSVAWQLATVRHQERVSLHVLPLDKPAFDQNHKQQRPDLSALVEQCKPAHTHSHGSTPMLTFWGRMAVSGIVGARVNPEWDPWGVWVPVQRTSCTAGSYTPALECCLSILHGMHEPVQKLTCPVRVSQYGQYPRV